MFGMKTVVDALRQLGALFMEVEVAVVANVAEIEDGSRASPARLAGVVHRIEGQPMLVAEMANLHSSLSVRFNNIGAKWRGVNLCLSLEVRPFMAVRKSSFLSHRTAYIPSLYFRFVYCFTGVVILSSYPTSGFLGSKTWWEYAWLVLFGEFEWFNVLYQPQEDRTCLL